MMDCGDETMEGFLEKRRDKVSFLWRRYWFRLKGGKLCYFKSRDCTSPHGVIEVNKIKTIGEVTSTGKNFSFEVVLSAEKTVILNAIRLSHRVSCQRDVAACAHNQAADSNEECKSWIETLLSKSSSARRSSSQKSISVWYIDTPPVDRLTDTLTSTENGATTNRNWTRKEAHDSNYETAPPMTTQKMQPTREPPPIPQRPPNIRQPPLKTPPLPPKLRKYSTPRSQGCARPASPTLEKLTIEDSNDNVFEEVIYDTPRPYPETLQHKDCPVKASSS